MGKVHVKVKGRALLEVFHPDQIHLHMERRRKQITGVFQKDLAKGMDIHEQSLSAMLKGKRPIGKDMVRRFNALDPEYELVPLWGLFRKKEQQEDGDI